MNDPAPTQISEAKWTISLGTLTLVLVCLFVGAAGGELLRNIAGAEKQTFSTTELVGFVLSVVLSAASIVLAIAAIWMGKVTELSVIRRSDESIRLQNEVFVRTTEALQRIEASTGVTEKRIEDIIQGRVGDISHKIAELATSRSGALRDPASLEDAIRSSILKSVKGDRPSDDTKEMEEARKRAEERQRRYREYHQALLNAFANLPDARTVKIGDGKFRGEGQDLFDVVIERRGQQVAASAFTAATALGDDYQTYLHNVAKTLHKGLVHRVVLAFDGESTMHEKVSKAISEALNQFKDDPLSKITVITTTAADLEAAVSALE